MTATTTFTSYEQAREQHRWNVPERYTIAVYPRLIEFVSDLPKILTGKIRRIELRESEQDRVSGS